jgi:hypothetical protein
VRPDEHAAAALDQGLSELYVCNEIFDGWTEELEKSVFIALIAVSLADLLP